MYGDLIGTREKQVFDALHGLSAEEARQVAYQYEVKYNLQGGQSTSPQAFRIDGSLLYSRLQGELTPHGEPDESAGDWARAQSLMRGDAATADAIALRTEAGKGWPFRNGQEMLGVLRQASPAERLAIIDAFAKDYTQQTHLAYSGIGARPVPATQTPEYSADPATLMMNVLKTRLGGSEFTEAVGLIAAAKYKDDPSVVASSQGQAAVGRLYSLLDRPFPDGAGALDVLKGLSTEERRYLQGQRPEPGGPSKLEDLMRSKLSAADFRQATAYMNGDAASAQATALYEALTRKVHSRAGAVPNPDVAAAERILRSVETDEQRRALLGTFERQYNANVTSLIPRGVSATDRDVLAALAQTPPEVLAARASTLASLTPGAAQASLEFRADVLRRSTQRLLGVDESAIREAFAGLAPDQARRLASMPLDPARPGSWTLKDELTQWHRGGGGGRFTLELEQMLDGDAAATGNVAEQIDEAQARYALETSGPGAALNDAIQSAFGSDARALLDADAARLQRSENMLRVAPTGEASRESASAALAYMDVGQTDYNTAKDRTTEVAKTAVTTVAVIGTTMATGGTAAAAWAPILAGASANVAANQLRGNANSWSDNVVAGLEGAANGIVLPGAAVAARGGQYVVREAVIEGGQVVFRNVPASLAREAATTAVTEGGRQVLLQGGQAMVRVGGRYFAVETFQQTLGQAVRQNVAEAVIGSVAGDVTAGTVRGDLRPEQVLQNAALAGLTGGGLTMAAHGAQALRAPARGAGQGAPMEAALVVVPPLESGVNRPLQDALVAAMRQTDVAEIGLRSSNPGASAWHGVGGGTVRDAAGTVRNPGVPLPLEPELVNGRRVFPRGPIPSRGAIFPTKPGGAVALTPELVDSLNATRAGRGLPPLHEAYPDMPIPRPLTLPDGTTGWTQQLAFGGVQPVIVNPVRDASHRIVDGDLLMAAPDVDIAYARGRDGHLLTDDEINAFLRPAINRTYSQANFPGVQYDVVNHGAHFRGMESPALRGEFDLDKPEYWNGAVHKFRADANGYTETANFGATYRDLVDPGYVPGWAQARIAQLEAQGHGFRRHGWGVGPQQLEDRVLKGIDPVTGTRTDAFTGRPHVAPRHATRVNSPEEYIRAEEYIRNSPEFRSLTANRRLDFAPVTVRLEAIYGPRYRDSVSGRTRLGSRRHPRGVVDTDFTDGTMFALYRRDAGGQWLLHTMYPEPRK